MPQFHAESKTFVFGSVQPAWKAVLIPFTSLRSASVLSLPSVSCRAVLYTHGSLSQRLLSLPPRGETQRESTHRADPQTRINAIHLQREILDLPASHRATMCGLMPCDSGTYDTNLYPNLARYRTPQHDINNSNTTTTTTTTTTITTTTTTTTNDSQQTYIPYSPQQQPASSSSISDSIRRQALNILASNQWRWCPACHGTRVCLVIGRCVVSGRRVRVAF